MNKYRLRYEWTSHGKTIPATRDFEATSPVSALNQIHEFMQLGRELENDRRTVVRSRLRPDEYRIVSLHHIYHDAAFERDPHLMPIVESEIDLPKSPNPVLKKTLNVYDMAVNRELELEFT